MKAVVRIGLVLAALVPLLSACAGERARLLYWDIGGNSITGGTGYAKGYYKGMMDFEKVSSTFTMVEKYPPLGQPYKVLHVVVGMKDGAHLSPKQMGYIAGLLRTYIVELNSSNKLDKYCSDLMAEVARIHQQ